MRTWKHVSRKSCNSSINDWFYSHICYKWFKIQFNTVAIAAVEKEIATMQSRPVLAWKMLRSHYPKFALISMSTTKGIKWWYTQKESKQKNLLFNFHFMMKKEKEKQWKRKISWLLRTCIRLNLRDNMTKTNTFLMNIEMR